MLLASCLCLQSQTVTNENSFTPAELAELKAKGLDPSQFEPVPSITNKDGQVISPTDVAYLLSQGYTDKEIREAHVIAPPKNQTTLSPTPSDLKGAYIWMDNFIGMTNAAIVADIISIKPETLKFRLDGKDYTYAGHYTVMLNTPRKHTNPYFGLGSPETAKILILENVGGDTFPLQNATIWEKSGGSVDATAMSKEWIYSGTFTIQN
jgi:hypothetical protein